MEPVGEEEAQLVLLSQNLSLSFTPNPIWRTTRLALKRRQRGDLHGRSTNLGFGKKAEMEEKSLAEKNHSIP